MTAVESATAVFAEAGPEAVGGGDLSRGILTAVTGGSTVVVSPVRERRRHFLAIGNGGAVEALLLEERKRAEIVHVQTVVTAVRVHG